MSLRSIKKCENQLSSNIKAVPAAGSNLFRKADNLSNQTRTHHSFKLKAITLNIKDHLQQQSNLSGRLSLSDSYLLANYRLIHCSYLVRTKSENDISTLLNNRSENFNNIGKKLLNAKSEVSLETITSHSSYHQSPLKTRLESNTTHSIMVGSMGTTFSVPKNMSLSSNITSSPSSPSYDTSESSFRRRSDSSIQSRSSYLQQTGITSSSALSLSSSLADAVMRVPIIGYEVMEERARFTVYKLRVENPASNECWLVLRRYTDFVRLNMKLQQVFPHVALILPRKKIFGDNFNSVFLDNRVQGLQNFVNSIMDKEELRMNKYVREFFCLDEPPTYSESMEECRAIFEAQEETIAQLKMKVNSKNDLIFSLQQQLRTTMAENESLKEAFKNFSLNTASTSRQLNLGISSN